MYNPFSARNWGILLQGNREESSFWRGMGMPAERNKAFRERFIKMRSGEERRVHFLLDVGPEVGATWGLGLVVGSEPGALWGSWSSCLTMSCGEYSSD